MNTELIKDRITNYLKKNNLLDDNDFYISEHKDTYISKKKLYKLLGKY